MGKVTTSATYGGSAPAVAKTAAPTTVSIPQTVFGDVYTDDPSLRVETTKVGKKISTVGVNTAVTRVDTLENPLRFFGRRRLTVMTGLGYDVPPPDTVGHEDGGIVEIEIPVNGASALTVPDIYDVRGDQFVTGRPHFLQIQRVGEGFVSFGHSRPIPDLAAPSLVSAVAVTGASQMTLVFDKAVNLKSFAALVLNFISGTARTVTSVVSGQNTTTIIVGLSGAISGGSVATLSMVAGTVNSTSGVPIAAVTNRALTIDFALIGMVSRIKASTATGSPIQTWVDSLGLLTLTQGTVGARATRVVADPLAKGKDTADLDGVDDFYSSAQTSDDSTEYCIFIPFVKFDSLTGDQAIINACGVGGDPNIGILVGRQLGNLITRISDGGAGTNQAGAAFNSTTAFSYFMRCNGTTIQVYINGVLFASFTGTVNPIAITQWFLGRLSNGSTWFLNGRIGEVMIARSTNGSAFTNDPVAAHAWAVVEYLP